MRSRSNLAAAWMANPANIDVVADGLAYIPWSWSALDQADAALQAQNLSSAVALARTDPAAARAMLAAIARDLDDHSSDKAYLTAFWSQPGVAASAANLSSLLRTTSSGGTIKSASKSDYSNVMSEQAGRKVTFMIYENEDAVVARGTYIVVPNGQDVVNYFDQQQEIASQDQADQEIRQAEQQEQAEIAEEEAEAEAEAEAMAMAEDDE